MWMIFENAGEAAIEALTTFGVSAKSGDNPIGFFGTGFKYAAAVILRHGGKMQVQLGEKKYTLGTREAPIRGESFNIVTLNRKDLGFTTSLGKGWELWMAYRELYSNMLDENGTITLQKTMPEPEVGVTRIAVHLEALLEVHQDRASIILNDKPSWVSSYVAIHDDGGGSQVFYRSIRAHQLETPSQYTYNVIAQIPLTEDRTIKHSFHATSAMVFAAWNCDNEEILRGIIGAPEGTMEAKIDYSTSGSFPAPPGPMFLKIAQEMRSAHQVRNMSILACLDRYIEVPMRDLSEGLEAAEQKDLDEALSLLRRNGWRKINKYPIKIAESLGNNVLGQAKDNTIWLARRLFTMGRTQIAGTILEEYMHLNMGLQDETREFQNYLLDMVITGYTLRESEQEAMKDELSNMSAKLYDAQAEIERLKGIVVA